MNKLDFVPACDRIHIQKFKPILSPFVESEMLDDDYDDQSLTCSSSVQRCDNPQFRYDYRKHPLLIYGKEWPLIHGQNQWQCWQCEEYLQVGIVACCVDGLFCSPQCNKMFLIEKNDTYSRNRIIDLQCMFHFLIDVSVSRDQYYFLYPPKNGSPPVVDFELVYEIVYFVPPEDRPTNISSTIQLLKNKKEKRQRQKNIKQFVSFKSLFDEYLLQNENVEFTPPTTATKEEGGKKMKATKVTTTKAPPPKTFLSKLLVSSKKE